MKITIHHLAVYNDKIVEQDISRNYPNLPDRERLKKEFHFAAMRILDNGFEGYVITPKGEVFQILQSKKTAFRVKAEEAKALLDKLGIEIT
jgi:predicted aspartyl protease